MADTYAGPLDRHPTLEPVKMPYLHEDVVSGGLETATGTVYTGPCRLRAIDLISAAAAVTCIVYDGTSATGTEVAICAAAIGGSGHICCSIECKIGIHIVLTGAGVNAVIRYST
jgi:hypothetical protein